MSFTGSKAPYSIMLYYRIVFDKESADLLQETYGYYGIKTIKKILKALRSYPSLSLKFDTTTRTFHILESQKIKIKDIEKIFNSNDFSHWIPVITGHDSERNITVKLQDVEIFHFTV